MMELESLSLSELIALRDELQREERKRLAYIIDMKEVPIYTLIQEVNESITKKILKLIK